MVNFPAVCEECGFTFSSGISGEKRVTVIGSTTQCPKCGSVAKILDASVDSSGHLHFAQSAYNILRGAAVNPKTIEKLKEIIQQHRESTQPEAKSFIESIESEIPELNELSKYVVPANAGEFYAMLTFLLTIIIFIQTMKGDTKESGATLINNYYGASDPESAGYRAAFQQGGLKRKSPCPCGSGKKYKNCHGKK